MKKSHIALSAALSLAFCNLAHATTEAANITPMTYESVSDVTAAKLASACPINIVQVSDQRFNKDSIGAEFPIVASAPEPWINKGLESLTAYGFTVQHNNQPVANAVNLNVYLIRAYTWYGNMRINGMVALDVEVVGNNGLRKEKFRAAGSKTNMWNGESEHVTALNYAFNHTLHKMAQSLQGECTQAKLAMQ